MRYWNFLAKLATLHSKGEIAVGEKFVYESILGTLFYGEIVGTTKVADYDAVIPKIAGSAYITGFNHFVIDETDPLKHGFIPTRIIYSGHFICTSSAIIRKMHSKLTKN